MDEPGKLGTALQHIGEHGDLRGLADSRTAKLALIKTAQQHGLAVWDKSRGRYQLTAEGYRRAAAWSPQIDATLRKRRSRQRTIAFAGIAAMLAGCIVVSAHVISDDAGRKTGAGRHDDFAAIGPIAARAKNGLWAMAGEPRQANAPPPAAANNAAANNKATPSIPKATPTGESDRRVADRLPTAAEQKARKIARAHRQQRLAASRERRQDTGYPAYTGSALAFGDDGRGARRGYPGYPSMSGPPVMYGRPNGWGW